MAYKHARFVIYYKSGNNKIEDRTDPKNWDNAPKYEYLCPKCGEVFPCFPELTLTNCLKCARENREVKLVRQTIITALGIQFDPLPLQEEGDPVMSKENTPLRVKLPTQVLKGSSVYNYGFFQEKLASIETKGEQKQQTHGLRIGMVVDPEGHCFCMVGHMGKGQPAIYSYYTTVHSLGIDEPALKLHGIKLSECGKRIVNKPGESIKQQISLNLGERLES
jgi:hypothetical protein